MASFNSTLRRQWRLIVFIIGLILIFWAMWALRGILLPFVLGFIFAVMVLPVIRWIERHFPVLGKRQRLRKLLRSIAVIIIYIIAVAIIGLFIFYLINIISNAIGTIRGNTSQLLPNGIDTIRNWLKSLPFLSSPTMQNTIDKYFNDIGSQLPSLLVSFLTKGWQYISGSINTIAGFIVLPLFIFYLLYDWERLRDNFYGGMSPWMRTHTIAVISILQDVVVRYIRGELILGITVGLAAWIMLTAFGIKAAFPLAIFSAATELVPMIGPWIGGALGVIVTLAVAPQKALWVALGYIAIQLLENHLLVPNIQGAQLKIHPAAVILLSILGAYFAGILGFIVILPATMAVIRLYRYFKDALISDTSKLDTNISEDFLPPEK